MFKPFQGLFMQNSVKMQARIAFRKPKDDKIHPEPFPAKRTSWILPACRQTGRFAVLRSRMTFPLHSSHSTLHIPLFTFHTSHSTPHIPLSTPHIPLSTLHIPHSTLHTPLFSLHIPHFTFHSPLFTLHTHLSSNTPSRITAQRRARPVSAFYYLWRHAQCF